MVLHLFILIKSIINEERMVCYIYIYIYMYMLSLIFATLITKSPALKYPSRPFLKCKHE